MNYNCGDTLKLNIKTKWNLLGFDAIIGNPPYHLSNATGTGNAIWNKFVIKSIDLINKNLSINQTHISRIPKYAAWVCGFSKLNYFATYDSTPDTYLINLENGVDSTDFIDSEIKDNIFGAIINNNNNNNVLGKPIFFNKI